MSKVDKQGVVLIYWWMDVKRVTQWAEIVVWPLLYQKPERRLVLVSNKITINVTVQAKSLFTTFETSRHFVDTRMNGNKAGRTQFKAHLVLFRLRRPLHRSFIYTTCCKPQADIDSICFNVSHLYTLQTSLARRGVVKIPSPVSVHLLCRTTEQHYWSGRTTSSCSR